MRPRQKHPGNQNPDTPGRSDSWDCFNEAGAVTPRKCRARWTPCMTAATSFNEAGAFHPGNRLHRPADEAYGGPASMRPGRCLPGNYPQSVLERVGDVASMRPGGCLPGNHV